MATPKPNPLMVKLIADLDHSNHAQVVRAYKELKLIGQKDKLWEMKRVHPKKVAVSKHNRGGFICSGIASHQVGETVMNVGYDPEVHKDATAFEAEDDGSSIQSFIALICNDEYLARYEAEDIEIVSVGSSHFNQFLAAAIDGRPTPSTHTQIQINNHLNKDVCMAHAPDMGEAFEGMTWCVWKKVSAVLYPQLPDIAQRALNAKYAAQQEEHNFHHYQRANLIMASNACKESGNENEYVLRDIVKSSPKNVDDVPSVVDFACKYGGAPAMVEPVMKFIRGGFMPPGRVVPGRVWKAMSKCQFAPADMCPLFMNSVLMFLAASPPSKCPGNVATWISVGDLTALQSAKLQDMKQAEEVIQTGMRLSRSMKLTSADDTKLLGSLRTGLVAKVLDKIEPLSKKPFYQHGAEFFDKAMKVAHVKSVKCPWKAASPEENPSQKGNISTVVQYNDNAEAVGLGKQSVLARGFEIGGCAKAKDSAGPPHPLQGRCQTGCLL